MAEFGKEVNEDPLDDNVLQLLNRLWFGHVRPNVLHFSPRYGHKIRELAQEFSPIVILVRATQIVDHAG